MEINYRAYQEQDQEVILQMLDEFHLRPSSLEYCLRRFPQNGLVALEGDRLVGCGFHGEADPEGGAMCQVFVHPDARRRRIGSTLLWRLQERMTQQGIRKLICDFEKNPAEIAFAEVKGLVPYFASRYMSYCGERCPVDAMPVEPYRDEDYEEVQKLVSEAFYQMQQKAGFPNPVPEPPSEQQRREYLDNASHLFVYRQQGEIIGFVSLDEDEIDCIAVRVDKQGQGIGKKLLLFATNELFSRGYQKIYLWVVVGNPAIRLYHRMQWVVESTHIFAGKELL